MGLKDSTIEIAANTMADAYENIEKIGATLTSILTPSNNTLDINVGSITKTSIDSLTTSTYPVMQGVACALAALFFLIALIDLANSDRFSLEQFIKFFAKLVIAAVLILKCQEITEKILEFGDAFANELASAGSNSDVQLTTREEIKTKVQQNYETRETNGENVTFITPLCDALLVFAPMMIISKVLVIVTYVVAMTRMIEIAIRSCLMPIAVSLMSDDGWRGAGGRYIRKFIAICAQGGVLVIIGRVTTTVITQVGMAATASSEMGDSLVIMIGVCVACVSMMFKSIGLINDAFGA